MFASLLSTALIGALVPRTFLISNEGCFYAYTQAFVKKKL